MCQSRSSHFLCSTAAMADAVFGDEGFQQLFNGVVEDVSDLLRPLHHVLEGGFGRLRQELTGSGIDDADERRHAR